MTLSQFPKMVPLAQLNDAPWNARKTFDAAATQELADSVKAHGILVPLIVRAVDVEDPEGNAFEIVAGHRRFHAAQLAGLDEVPCIVRDLDEDQARELGMVDNVQREDLQPMEEAEAYGKLLAEPSATVESVAAVIGKSPSYVGQRAQLLKAIVPVREALAAGAIEVGHALQLARLSEELQAEWLQQMEVEEIVEEDGDEGDGETGAGVAREWSRTQYSVAELRREIAQRALKVLSDAPFPLDACLPVDGAVPCTVCPKRTINSAVLFADLPESDSCTDRACFGRKTQAWIEHEMAAAKDQGRKLVKLSSRGLSSNGVVAFWNMKILKAADECGKGEEAIWVDGGEVARRVWICREPKCIVHRPEATREAAPSSVLRSSQRAAARDGSV